MATATPAAPPAESGAVSGKEFGRMEGHRRVLIKTVKERTAERDDAIKERDRLAMEVERLNASTDKSALAKQNAELQGKLRTFEHRKTFDRLASERGITDPKAQDILYDKSGWKAEADEFDEAEMGATIDATIPEYPFLKGAAAPQDGGQAAPIVKPGPGSGAGGVAGRKGSSNEGNHLLIRDDDPRWLDAAWQASTAGQEAMIAHSKEKKRRGLI
jgi:hypothetical protein